MGIRLFEDFQRSVKFLVRARSFDFMLHWSERPATLRQFKLWGRPFYYRSGTGDISALNEVIFRKGKRAEYYFPQEHNPEVIFDVGGHIGTSAVYYARKYPDALVYVFEPAPDNYEILRRNVELYPNIRPFNFGLGAENGSFHLVASEDPWNTGGYSLAADKNVTSAPDPTAKVRKVREILKELAIQRIDLIKIDTEGAEYDILTAFPDEVLAKVKWIIGELHDCKDFELLAHLSKWSFIGITKDKIGFPFSIFRAVNKGNGLAS